MNLKKFIGPVILAGISILIFVSINISANTQYNEGDTVDSGLNKTRVNRVSHKTNKMVPQEGPREEDLAKGVQKPTRSLLGDRQGVP